MAKFKYKLQNLLNIKEKLEDAKKQEYSKALFEVSKVEEEKKGILDYKEKIMNETKNETTGRLSAFKIKQHNLFYNSLEKKEKEIEKKLMEKKKNADKKKEDLVEAMRERKTLETLKESELIKFKKEENIKEQNFVDEIISYKESNKKE